MRRTPIFSLFLALLFALAASAGDLERQARELAEEVLAGKELHVRVYNNWREDPREYKHVSVKLDGLSFGHNAVKAAFPAISKSAVIVVAGQDQTDEAVGMVLEGYVYVESYDATKTLSIWPRDFNKRQSLDTCIFKDSLRQPVPNAEVEIWMGVDPHLDSGPRVMIAKAKLDEAGLLQPPRFVSSWQPCFVVHHPDCGPRRAIYVPLLSVNEPHKSFLVPALPKDKWCVFTDALGEPIANATVEILEGQHWDRDRRVLIGKVKLDEKGRLKPPRLYSRLEWCHFIVYHPEYGTALAEPRLHNLFDKLLTNCTVPLVRAGSRADERSVWGTVVDPNGNPISGALIACRGVRTPGGGGISTPERVPYKVLTDEDGRFCMYLPIEKDSSKHGTLVPLASKYFVNVGAPKALGLKNYSGQMSSGEETTIALQLNLAYDRKPPILAFEDELGIITDPDFLGQIRIRISRNGGMSSGYGFTYEGYKGNKRFIPGIYTAMANWNGGKYIFEPVDVNEQIPEQIIFKIRKIRSDDIIYKGRVINGVTGEPMRGVVVITFGEGKSVDASSLTSEQWNAIQSLGPEPEPDDPVLKPLKEIFAFTKITKTDQVGRFQFAFKPGNLARTETVAAIREDFLGSQWPIEDPAPKQYRQVDRRTKNVELNENGNVILPLLRLFPSAKVIVEPNLPVPARSRMREVRYQFLTSPDDTTSWLSDFRKTYILYNHDLQPNRIQTVCVPAGIAVTIRLYDPTPQSIWAPMEIRGMKLKQGQILDLGRRDFLPTLKVAVKVIDSSAKAVEGVSVTRVDDSGLFLLQGAITNEDGIAFLNVSRYSKGKFIVQYENQFPSKSLQESTVYEVADQEDAGRQFTLQISDEMLYQLFK